MRGVVKRVVAERGFGFIQGQDGADYFFHRSAVEGAFGDLEEDAEIEFEPSTGPKGPRAARVRPTASQPV